MKLLGVDYGRKRIGFATGNTIIKIAHPLAVLHRKNRSEDLQEISEYIEDHDISHIVVGHPRNMDNTCGEMANEAQKFANLLSETFDLPVTLWDERLTSWQAEAYLKERGIPLKKRAEMLDAAAAAVILQCYMNENF